MYVRTKFLVVAKQTLKHCSGTYYLLSTDYIQAQAYISLAANAIHWYCWFIGDMVKVRGSWSSSIDAIGYTQL